MRPSSPIRPSSRRLAALALALFAAPARAEPPRPVGAFDPDRRAEVHEWNLAIAAVEAIEPDRVAVAAGRDATVHVALPAGDHERLCLSLHGAHASYVLTAAFDISNTPAGVWSLGIGADVPLAGERLVPDARLSERCDDLLDAPRVLAAWSAAALDSALFRVYVNARGRDAQMRFLESAAGEDGSVRAFGCTRTEPPDGATFDTECVVDRAAPLRFDGGWVLLSVRGAPVTRSALDVRLPDGG